MLDTVDFRIVVIVAVHVADTSAADAAHIRRCLQSFGSHIKLDLVLFVIIIINHIGSLVGCRSNLIQK
jgi:hypothetical protein